jgi:hypothetical protein
MTDIVVGALIGAGSVLIGGIVAGSFDLIGRGGDREHDSTERQAERDAAATARREEREAAERAVWRDRAAGTLGRAYEFPADVHPANATALATLQTARTQSDQLAERWAALREPMGELIVGLPTAAERDAAEDVLERFRKIHNGLSWVLHDIWSGKGRDSKTILDLTSDWTAASAEVLR